MFKQSFIRILRIMYVTIILNYSHLMSIKAIIFYSSLPRMAIVVAEQYYFLITKICAEYQYSRFMRSDLGQMSNTAREYQVTEATII